MKPSTLIVVSLVFLGAVSLIGTFVLVALHAEVPSEIKSAIAAVIAALAMAFRSDTAPAPTTSVVLEAPSSPKVPPLPVLLLGLWAAPVLLALGLVLTGCTGSFEEARGVRSVTLGASSAPIDRDRCVRLDDERIEDSAKAKAFGGVAGAGAAGVGILELVRDEGAPKGVVIGVGTAVTVLGSLAGYFLVRAEGKSAAWVRECSQ